MDPYSSPQASSPVADPAAATDFNALRVALREANDRAAFQAKEAKKLAAALAQVQSELLFQAAQAKRRGEELEFANRQLLAQYSRSDTQADELVQANRGLAVALDALAVQFQEKEKRAAELHIANIELDYQNSEKDQRASELATANRELEYQNSEKEKRASELVAANKELEFQNSEKEKRASELVAANKELEFQNSEKEKRASELVAANIELEYQNSEKEKRAAELLQAIAELEAFAFISSHDLQEPIRKILLWLDQLSAAQERHFSDKEKVRFNKIVKAAQRMRQLIQDLYTYSRVSTVGQQMEQVYMNVLLNDVMTTLAVPIAQKGALVKVGSLCSVFGVRSQIRLLVFHLLDNAIKFSKPGIAPQIRITAVQVQGEVDPELAAQETYCRFTIEDEGIGFEGSGSERIFDVFQRLHGNDEYPGTGIGLALVRKITLAHKGVVRAQSKAGAGSVFTVFFPVKAG